MTDEGSPQTGRKAAGAPDAKAGMSAAAKAPPGTPADVAHASTAAGMAGAANVPAAPGAIRPPDIAAVTRNAYLRLFRRWPRWGTLLLVWTAVFWGAEALARHLWQDESWYPFNDSDHSLLAWLALGGIWLAYFTCWLAGSGPASPGPRGEAKEKEIRRNAFFRVPAVFLFAGVMIGWFTVFSLVMLSLVIAWDVAPARAVFAGAGGVLLLVATILFARTAFALPAWALNHKGGPRRAWAMTGRIGIGGIARVWALLTGHILVFATLFIAIRGFLLPTPWLWTELAVHGLLTAVAYTGLLTVMMLTTLAYRDARGLPIHREPAPPEKTPPLKSP